MKNRNSGDAFRNALTLRVLLIDKPFSDDRENLISKYKYTKTVCVNGVYFDEFNNKETGALLVAPAEDLRGVK